MWFLCADVLVQNYMIVSSSSSSSVFSDLHNIYIYLFNFISVYVTNCLSKQVIYGWQRVVCSLLSGLKIHVNKSIPYAWIRAIVV